MKKKIIFLVILFLLIFKVNVASASILQREFIDNVWSFHYRNGKVWTYGQLNIKHIDGKIGYCIEPDSAVNTDQYIPSNDWSKSKFNDEVKRKMELYAYYGFHYPGHNNIKYYMATQELIWLFSEDEKIKWTTEDHSDSSEINVENEKAEIINLVNKHDLLPSFSGIELRRKVGENVCLKDDNNVINSFDISPSFNVTNNSINFTMTDEPIKINFQRKNLLYNETIVYTASIRSQRVATFANPTLNKGSVTINPKQQKVHFTKRDKDNNNLIKDGKTRIRITNLKNNISEECQFPKEGEFDKYFLPGKYSIEEINASTGYLKNKECTLFEVSYDKDNNIDYYNEPAKGKIRIKKVDLENNYVDGCRFGIFNLNNEKITEIVTTKNEYDESIMLPLGKYLVKELEAKYGYKKDEKVYKINLDYVDDKTNPIKDLELINEKIKCKTTIIGVDNNDLDIDITFNIFDENDNLIYTGSEREHDLQYGNYYVVATSVPNGYKLNNQKIHFTVNDNSCLSTIKIVNDKINMPITSTKNISLFSIITLILNIGIFKIVKKFN